MTIEIIPFTRQRVTLQARAIQPIVHGDPDVVDDSNVKPFRRRAQLVHVDTFDAGLDQAGLDRVLAGFAIPVSLRAFFTDLSAPELLAVGVLKAFMEAFSSRDGEGIFTGVERYSRLNARVKQAASRTETLRGFWSDLCASMQVSDDGKADLNLLALLSTPRSLTTSVLRTLTDQAETTLMLARVWFDAQKTQNARYAEASQKTFDDSGTYTPAYAASGLPAPLGTLVRQVPEVSGNAIRHCLVREPGTLHMLRLLGIGLNELPPHTAYMLLNGNELRKGASAPDDEHRLGWEILQRYPLLELVSGCTDRFVMPESALKVGTYLVCIENVAALEQFGVKPEHPAERLIDRVSLVRHPDAQVDASPMPFSFETLIVDTRFVFDFTLRPFASRLAFGALAAALTEAQSSAVIGGKSGVGFGRITFDLPESLEAAKAAYETYLQENSTTLRAGLLDGTLGTNLKLVA